MESPSSVSAGIQALADIRVEQCASASASGDKQEVDEKSRQIMVSTPTGKVVILTVTNETTFRQVKDELFKSENINPSSQHLIWNGEALHPDDDLSKVLLETTTGLAVLHLMGGTQIFVYDLNRKITLNVEADDTIRDVINHVIAMLGGSNYVLERNGETLIEEKTVAY